jgi:glycosyltransferase involved in cell wall biosynthesis
LLKEVNRIARRLGVEKHIHNVGAIPVAEAPRLYKSCQLCFIPTVLETFSATYVEAMAMHVPIVASDFGFARDTCGTAARYFRPNHVRDAADKILDVYGDSRLRQELVELGEDRVHTFPSASERYRRYVALAENMLSDRTLAMALGETNAQ